MPHYDYLQNQIDELGRFLAQLISDFLKMKNGGQSKEAFELVENSLKKELDFSLDTLICISPEDTIALLKSEQPLSFIHLDHLAKILFQLAGMEEDQEKKIKLFKQSELFYNYLLDKDPIYSYERYQAIETIKMILKDKLK